MRQLIVTEFVTLDGVMEAPGGEDTHPGTNWVGERSTPEQVDLKFRETMSAETLLIGRTTYESFAGAWPGYDGPFADKMNSMEKVVVSSTLTDPTWTNTRVIDGAGDVAASIGELKASDGGLILVTGSATLVHFLIEHDLVDELRLMVFPVTIGHGLRVFPDARTTRSWALHATEALPGGTRVDTWRPA